MTIEMRCKLLLMIIGLSDEEIEAQEDNLAYFIDVSKRRINDFCNTTSVPPELDDIVAKYAVGSLLDMLISTNKLKIEDIDFKADVVKQITEGDVTVMFSSDSVSDEQKIRLLIEQMKDYELSRLVKYRRLVW